MWILWTLFAIGVAMLVLEFGCLIGQAKVYGIISSVAKSDLGDKLNETLAEAYGEKTIEYKILRFFIEAYTYIFDEQKG